MYSNSSYSSYTTSEYVKLYTIQRENSGAGDHRNFARFTSSPKKLN